jgi:signal transduction histidine kinase
VDPSELRADPDGLQPPLSRWGHGWRLAVMLGLSATVWVPVASWQWSVSPWWTGADLALGLVAYVLVHLRRRSPVAVAVTVAVLAAFSGASAGPAVLALVSVATRRRWREVVPLGLLNLATAQLWTWLTLPTTEDSLWVLLVANIVAVGAMIGWGLYLGSRRELVWTLRQRAERAEAEQELRVAQSRTNERARIAREMHDVLGHRISQISMQAGALGYRSDLDLEQMRAGTAVIQQQAHEALRELRVVLGVLRDADGAVLDAPQPTYADVADLVEGARSAGQRVELVDALGPDRTPPDLVGRTVYRIVQEGLTNAGRHAPGALLTVSLSGSPEEGLSVELRNPVGFGSALMPGAGLGLVGLTERAELGGGRLEHERSDGCFVVRGWLPWAS